MESDFLSQAMLHAKNALGMTPLHCAAATGSVETASEIIAQLGREWKTLETTDASGATPVECALQHGQLLMAKMLVSDQGGPSTRALGLDLAARWPGLGSSIERSSDQFRATMKDLADPVRKPASRTESDALPCPQRVLKGREEVLEHLEVQVRSLGARLSGHQPRDAVEALLRHHVFDIEAAAEAYDADPRTALDAAGLASVSDGVLWFTPPTSACASFGSANSFSAAPSPTAMSGPSSTDVFAPSLTHMIPRPACIVCFELAVPGRLACGHITCDDCLRCHIRARVEECDVAGLVCSAPGCRVVIPEVEVERLFPSAHCGTGEDHNDDDAGMLARLQALRAQQFVDSSLAIVWCPRPGCSHAVTLAGAEQVRTARTVECSCGTRFCSLCHEILGHEPAGCEHWRRWQELSPSAEQEKASKEWLRQNSQQCPRCRASIQRNGGCNHMICSCGEHFCHMCGQQWELHQGQPGGMDYYNCLLRERAAAPAPAQESTSMFFLSCHSSAEGNRRDEAWEYALLGLALALGEEFGLGEEWSGFMRASVMASLRARRALHCSYVLKYYTEGSCWSTCLSRRVAELEVATQKLEHASGLRLLADAARARGYQSACDLTAQNPRQVLCRLDLRWALPHAVAASDMAGLGWQWATGVQLQTGRLIASSRRAVGKGGKGPPWAKGGTSCAIA